MSTIGNPPRNFRLDLSMSLRNLGTPPGGYGCEVYFHRRNKKTRRDAAFEENSDADSIRIAFSPMEEEVKSATGKVASAAATAKPESAEGRLSDFVRALDRAERRREFVSLTWFRETVLVHEGFSWAADEFARRHVVREAIDRGWILTSKVENPRSPDFPVTAIRLNRQMPEVSAVLGNR